MFPTGPRRRQRVTELIETGETPPTEYAAHFVTNDPTFGIWRDREDRADVKAYQRKLRAPCCNRDGSRDEG